MNNILDFVQKKSLFEDHEVVAIDKYLQVFTSGFGFIFSKSIMLFAILSCIAYLPHVLIVLNVENIKYSDGYQYLFEYISTMEDLGFLISFIVGTIAISTHCYKRSPNTILNVIKTSMKVIPIAVIALLVVEEVFVYLNTLIFPEVKTISLQALNDGQNVFGVDTTEFLFSAIYSLSRFCIIWMITVGICERSGIISTLQKGFGGFIRYCHLILGLFITYLVFNWVISIPWFFIVTSIDHSMFLKNCYFAFKIIFANTIMNIIYCCALTFTYVLICNRAAECSNAVDS